MFNSININHRQNVNFGVGNINKVNLRKGIEYNLDAFENKMLAEEKAAYGYLLPEVRRAIEDKIQSLKLKAKNINPRQEEELVKPLQEAIEGRYDITETYLALGEFEKRLSNF